MVIHNRHPAHLKYPKANQRPNLIQNFLDVQIIKMHVSGSVENFKYFFALVLKLLMKNINNLFVRLFVISLLTFRYFSVIVSLFGAGAATIFTAPAPSKPFRRLRLRLRPKCVGSGGSGSGSGSGSASLAVTNGSPSAYQISTQSAQPLLSNGKRNIYRKGVRTCARAYALHQ